MKMKKERVLVAGAHGTTGKHLINLLVESSTYEPIAMVRKEEQKSFFEEQGIESVFGDLTEDISHTVENIDKVIFAAGSKGENLEAVDKNGAIKLIDASENHGVDKFVMLSSMGADDPTKSEDLQDYLNAKKEADEYLQNSSLNYTIVRPGSLTNDDPKHQIMLEKTINSSGSIPRADVAETLVGVLETSKRNKEHFDILSGNNPISEIL